MTRRAVEAQPPTFDRMLFTELSVRCFGGAPSHRGGGGAVWGVYRPHPRAVSTPTLRNLTDASHSPDMIAAEGDIQGRKIAGKSLSVCAAPVQCSETPFRLM